MQVFLAQRFDKNRSARHDESLKDSGVSQARFRVDELELSFSTPRPTLRSRERRRTID